MTGIEKVIYKPLSNDEERYSMTRKEVEYLYQRYIPCVVAVASTYNETHSAKWTVRIAIYYICVALLMSFVVYHVAALFL